MSTTSGPQTKSSLRLTFAFILSVMVTLTAVVIISVSYFGSRQSTLTVSETIMAQVAQVTDQRIRGFLTEPRLAVEVAARNLTSGVVDTGDLSAVEACLYDAMHTHPTLNLLNYGDAQGRFVMVKRMDDGSLSTKLISVSDEEGRQVEWRHREVGAPVGDVARVQPAPDDIYDPRKRPWYQTAVEAGSFAWTDVYVFYTDQIPGLTAATPVRRDGELIGVVSADIGLMGFSSFLAQVEVGKAGSAVLMSHRGEIIGSPRADDLVVERTSDAGETTLELRPAAESHMPAIQALGEDSSFIRSMKSDQFEGYTLRLEVGEPTETWLGWLQTIEVEPDKTWLVAVVAPEDDFLGDVKRLNTRNVMMAVIFSVGALIVSLLLARWISNSLQKLVIESERIRALEFDDPVDLSSPFKEVFDVLDAFDGMKTGLRSFQKYMPVDLVRILLERHEEPELQSELQRVTVYFSDIAGFTTVSEQVGPEDMAWRLGHYLGSQSKVIRSRQGTVVQYVGDAIMAFWNAPLPVDGHPTQATLAALECQEVVAHLWEDETDAPSFPTRMGVHTTEVAVGHFGSPDRLYYGAVGDGVNIAARLESANKQYGTWIILSEDTHRELPEGLLETRRLDTVVLKGRATPTGIYELLGQVGQVPEDVLKARDLYEEGLSLYFDRQWDEAIQRFRAARALRHDDLAAEVFIERAECQQSDPPPPDWDRAHHLEKK